MNRVSRPLLAGAAIGLAGVVALILALTLTGGSNSSGPNAVGSTGTRAKTPADAAQLWLRLAACLRSHGYAIADPVVRPNGTADWGGANGNSAFKRAMIGAGLSSCQEQLRALPAQDVNPPVAPTRLHQLRLFARCMRAHGLSDWPDPHPDGTFPLDAHLISAGKLGTRTQMAACGQYLDGGSLSISPSSAPTGQQPSGTGG